MKPAPVSHREPEINNTATSLANSSFHARQAAPTNKRTPGSAPRRPHQRAMMLQTTAAAAAAATAALYK